MQGREEKRVQGPGEIVGDGRLDGVSYDEFERDVARLAHAPVGAELAARDYALLLFLGVLLPAALLIWGWL